MLQDKSNVKNCGNCIHTTHFSQIRQLSRSRTDPCDMCDYIEHGDETFVPSNWEERLSESEIEEYETRLASKVIPQ